MIHLIVGNTGAGKTTYSEQLKKKTKGVVFSIDKWNKILFLDDKKTTDGLDWFLERISRSEKIIMDLIHQLENSKTDTILDLGFSKLKHREKFRAFAKTNNYKLTTHFLDISREVRLGRIAKRNNEKGATFQFEVTQEDFNFMENWFEKPTEKEMIDGVVLKN